MLGKRVRSERFLKGSSNRKNLNNLRKLDFFLDNKTYQRFQRLCRGQLTEQEFDAECLLDLGSQSRVFYEIEDVPESMDAGWQRLLRFLICSNIKPEHQELITYEAYKSNSIQVGKQKIRFFKFLKKNKILTNSEIEEVTTARQSQQKLYFCISRNPVDFLFASTNQSFTSCLSLDSDYTGAFYLGLPGAMLDPNRALVFVTNGKFSRYYINGLEFKHFRYLSRSWAILSEFTAARQGLIRQGLIKSGGCQAFCPPVFGRMGSTYKALYIVKEYPNDNYDLKSLMRSALCKSGMESKFVEGDVLNPDKDSIHVFKRSQPATSIFSFETPRFEDGGICMPYIDGDMGIYRDSQGVIRYTNGVDGYTGWIGPDFCNGSGFENLDSFDSAFEDDSYCCEECGTRIYVDDTWHNERGDCFCESCYRDLYIICDSCHNEALRDEGYDVEGDVVCEYCYNEYCTECSDCGEAHYTRQLTENVDGELVCDSCAEDHYVRCDECGGYVFKDSVVSIGGYDFCSEECGAEHEGLDSEPEELVTTSSTADSIVQPCAVSTNA